MSHEGCPGSRVMQFQAASGEASAAGAETASPSELRQWPVQLHLVPPSAPYFEGADVLLSADCVAYAMGSFHAQHLRGKALAIACPKLDDGQEAYTQKVKSLIDDAQINSLTVMIMQVPCCGGLLAMASSAAAQAKRKIPIKSVMVGLQGEILREEWVKV